MCVFVCLHVCVCMLKVNRNSYLFRFYIHHDYKCLYLFNIFILIT